MERMGLLSGETPRETAIAWGFVLVQGLLIFAVLLLPAGDDWTLSSAGDAVAVALEWIGTAILVVGLVKLGRSLTALPTPVPHGELKVGGLFRFRSPDFFERGNSKSQTALGTFARFPGECFGRG